MQSSHSLLRGIVCLAAFAGSLSAQTQAVAILPGAQSTATTIPVISTDPFTPQLNISGVPAGAFQVIPKTDGTKYYVISAQAGGVTILNHNLAQPRALTGISGTPSKAAISPDGRILVVISGNTVYFVDTVVDTIRGTGNVSGTPIDVAFSHDSLRAFILSNGLSGGSQAAFITPFDITLPTPSAGQALVIPVSGPATGIATAPNGLLYVTALNALFEIEPRTLQRTTTGALIAVNGSPSKPVFTPDAKYALSVNETASTGNLAFVFDLPEKSVRGVPRATQSSLSRLDRILVASENRYFAYARENQTLYELLLSGGLNETGLRFSIPTNAVSSVAISDDYPARTMLIAATFNGANTLFKVDPVTLSIDPNRLTLPAEPGNVVQWIGLAPTSGEASIRGFNLQQTLTNGGTGLPLIARVLDAQQRPVSNALVNFSATGSVTLSATTAFTSSDGYVQTYATIPNTPGTYTVQANAPTLVSSVSYTLTVPGDVGPCVSNCPESNLVIVSGTGQIISEQNTARQLLLVETRDTNGVPAGGQTVTFSVSQGSGTVSCTTVGDEFPNMPTGSCTSDGLTVTAVTDVNGRAGVKYLATSIFGQSFAQTVVTASSGVSSVNFVITTVLVQRPNNGGQASLPIAYILLPEQEASGYRIIRGAAGQTIANAIQVQVVAADGPQAGQPIPNVALNVSGFGDPLANPSGRCAGGTPLTDTTGVATCNLTLGPVVRQNPTELSVNVGGAINTPLILIQVTQGAPSQINLLQGNGQSGRAGQVFLLRAAVVDAAGNPSQSVPVTWQVVQGSGTLSGASNSTNAQGEVQANLTLGSNPGNVVVRVTAGTAPGAITRDFTLTVTATVGGISAVSGGGQTAVVGQAFTNPVVVQVLDESNRPVPGAAVTFSVVSGAATVATPNATANAQGNAQTAITAGNTAGAIVIRATSGGRSTDFTLTSRLPGPSIGTTNFRNAASGAAGLTPCGIAIVSGGGVAPGVQGTVQANQFVGPLPYTLANASIEVNGIPAPIFWVSNTQQGGEAIAFQTPCEVSPGAATVTVRVGGGSTTVSGVAVNRYQPGIFDTTFNNRRYAVLVRPDGSYVTPENPARRGETVKMFVTGIGPVTPATGTNRAGTGQQISNAAIAVGVNDRGVRVERVEYMAGAIGIYVITFEIPSDTAQGPYQNLGLIVSDPNDPNAQPNYALGSFLPIL